MEHGANQKAKRLFDHIRDGFALLPRYDCRAQGVEDDDSFAGGIDAAIKAGGGQNIIAGYELSQSAGAIALRGFRPRILGLLGFHWKDQNRAS